MSVSSRPVSRALVTGGAGFVGSWVAERAAVAGQRVVVLDDLSSGDRANVPAGVDLFEVDITDAAAFRAVVDEVRPDVVHHLAAQASVVVSVRDPALDQRINVLGTLNVCEAAAAVGARVVFASTGGALYGDDATLPADESTPAEPLAPYGASKLAGEAYVATWGRLHGQPNVILRLANVYGPRQNAHGEAGVVAIFCGKLFDGERPIVFGDGLQTRDYIHVSDVAAAFMAASVSGSPGCFNVGTARQSSVLDLIGPLQAAAGRRLEPDHREARAGELRRSALDASLIRRTLGWSPEIGLAEGLASTYRAYLAARTARVAE